MSDPTLCALLHLGAGCAAAWALVGLIYGFARLLARIWSLIPVRASDALSTVSEWVSLFLVGLCATLVAVGATKGIYELGAFILGECR